MAELNDWSTTDANNNSAPPDGWPENTMNYSEVNDTGRAVQGKIKRFFADINGSLAATGTANAYAVTLNAAYTGYFDGMTFTCTIPVTNTGASTINVNSIGAINVRTEDFEVLTGGQLQADGVYTFYYDGGNSTFRVAGTASRMSLREYAAVQNVSGAGSVYSWIGIDPWVRKITIEFASVRISASGTISLELGDAGGIETTGYTSEVAIVDATPTVGTSSTFFFLALTAGGTSTLSGHITLTNVDGNRWVASSNLADTVGGQIHIGGGDKTLTGTLTQFSITAEGAPTFVSGLIKVRYEN